MAEIVRVAGPVFAGPSADGGVNAGFVRTKLGALVIDAFLTREDGRDLAAVAESEAGRITATVYTHEHLDHVLGSTDFPAGGVIVSSGTARGLRRDLKRYGEELERQGLRPKLPTLIFDCRITLPWDPEVVVVELGGHAEGSTVVHVPGERVLFAGDLVFRGRPPFVGSMGPERWLAALRTLEGWDVETVIPGHGATGGRKVLTEQRVWLEDFLGRVSELRSAGTPLEKATTILAGEFGFEGRRVEGLRLGLQSRLGFGAD